MTFVLLLLLLMQPLQDDNLWNELQDLSRRVSPEFAEENWVYSITWKGEFLQANGQLLEYYSRQALTPAQELSGRAPLVRMQESGLLIPDTLPQLRDYLAEQDVSGCLNLVINGRDGVIWVVCQVIAEDASKDNLFSVELRMTADLALLMTPTGDTTRPLNDSLVQRLYLDQVMYAICSAELDGRDGKEIAVLSAEELLVLSTDSVNFRVTERIPLRSFLPSFYPNRKESGRLFAVRDEQKGIDTLLFSANIFRAGGYFNPAQGLSAQQLEEQPLPRLGKRPEQQETSTLMARYVHGENNRVLVPVSAVDTSQKKMNLVFKDFVPVENQVSTALVMTRSSDLYLLDPYSEALTKLPASGAGIKHIFHAYRQEGNLFIWAIVPNAEMNDSSGDSIVLLRLDDVLTPLMELRSQLDIVDATLYNSDGQTREFVLIGVTRQQAFVLEHHSLQ